MGADQDRQPVPVAAPPAGARSFTPPSRSYGATAPTASMNRVPTVCAYTRAQVNAAIVTIIAAGNAVSDQCGLFVTHHCQIIRQAIYTGMWETDAGK